MNTKSVAALGDGYDLIVVCSCCGYETILLLTLVAMMIREFPKIRGPCIRPLIFGMINTTMTMVVFVMVVSTLTMRMVVLTTVNLI